MLRIYRFIAVFLMLGGAIWAYRAWRDLDLNVDRISLPVDQVLSRDTTQDMFVEILDARADNNFEFGENGNVLFAIMPATKPADQSSDAGSSRKVVFVFKSEDKIKQDCDLSNIPRDRREAERLAQTMAEDAKQGRTSAAPCSNKRQTSYEGILRAGFLDDMSGSAVIKNSKYYLPLSNEKIFVLYEGEQPPAKAFQYLFLAGGIFAFICGLLLSVFYIYKGTKSA